jgi:hypothetical protein
MVIQNRISVVNAKKHERLSLISKEFSNVICGFRIVLDMSTPGVSMWNILSYSYTSTLHPSSLTEHVKATVVINAL